MDLINTNRLLETFLQLLEINSPSRHEGRVADYVSARLGELGMSIVVDDAGKALDSDTGNIIATLPATADGGTNILLCAHMDTVAPTDGMQIVCEDGIIRQTGAGVLGADDKAGLASIIEAIASTVESGRPHGQIQALILICEEIGLLGSKHLDMNHIDCDLGYVLDSGSPVGHLVSEAPSHDNIIATFTGRAAHAGVCPEEGISAIAAAASAISKMKLGRVDFETTSNVGIINGGTARNVIPERCELRAEARSRDQGKLEQQVSEMRQALEESASSAGASVDIQVTRQYLGYKHAPDSRLVKFAVEAARTAQIDPQMQAHGGGSDCNILNGKGLPCAVIGVGYEKIHTPDEYIPIADLNKCAEITAALIARSAQS